MDAALAGAVPHFRSPAGGQVAGQPMIAVMSNKTRTALILATIAAAFFIGVVIRHWIW
jgi:hypothetical protein